MSDRTCADLRVEYLPAPIGVGTPHPRFSWRAPHAAIAYRLQVRTGGVIVWDTGRTETAPSTVVEYRGTPLTSNTAYEWQISSWDASGDRINGFSTFETGLLNSDDWVASWVAPVQEPTVTERWTLLDWIVGKSPEKSLEARLQPAQLLRQSFHLSDVPIRARLYATARGVYSATVNGLPADDQVLAPGFDSYMHRISVQCYDVTSLLVAGENVLGFALADGWWAGRLGISGSSAQFGDTISAIWELHLDLPDGGHRVVPSGEDVLSTPGPWRYADLFIGECFDAAAWPTAWDQPAFVPTDWTPVLDQGRDTHVLVPFTGEPIRRVDELAPVSVQATADGWLVDFGQVIAGRVRLEMFNTVPGQRVVLEHTEVVDADGN
ncbi:family 78 glycoside hydrolase catalytic domain [Microbacterium sp.]|uniref:family 78 glycoside hydrolase catalytic domain n=1 Tax=Microbacterium sp. TaxID=51671 RepID=UPI0035ADFFA8